MFYGCKIVAARIKGSGWERHELGLFSKIVTKLMEEDRLRRQAVEGRFLAIEK